MDISKLIDNITKWLKDYSQKYDVCFVVGVSGGIDSAVVSTLCAKTGIQTHLLSLPISQNEEQLNLCNQHLRWLEKNFSNVTSHTIDLTSSFEHFKKTLSKYETNLGLANTKSRLRMCTLYQVCGFYKGIVVGTGNKIEDFGIGFFTKYGDGGVDISPIADLTKSEVRSLAKEMKINELIINAKPTDGLWDDDRTDEEQIGCTYEDLEWAMEFCEKNDESSINKTHLSDKEIKTLTIYKTLNKQNKHKMETIPIFKKL